METQTEKSQLSGKNKSNRAYNKESTSVTQIPKLPAGEDLIGTIKPIEGTPFVTMKQKDGYIKVYGKYALTSKRYKTHEEAVESMKQVPTWEEIISFVGITVDFNVEQLKKQK